MYGHAIKACCSLDRNAIYSECTNLHELTPKQFKLF